MKTKTEPVPAVKTTTTATDKKFLGPCVIAALVWLMLSIYMLWVVPAQLDIRENLLKPEELRRGDPAPLRFAMFIHTYYGTTILSLLGLIGCGLAYVLRSVKIANRMIAAGAICLLGLVYVVVTSLPAGRSIMPPIPDKNPRAAIERNVAIN